LVWSSPSPETAQLFLGFLTASVTLETKQNNV
jgi:hypothetical protein